MNSLNIDIEDLIKIELPPLPGPALKVAALTQDMKASAYKIAEAIGVDPILAARVIRAANSPLYGLSRPVTSLLTAVTTLGDRAIYQLVVAIAASDVFRNNGLPSAYEQKLWKHSLTVGLMARDIAITLGMRGSEEAFLAGLIHDLGRTLLLRYNKKTYTAVTSLKTTEEQLNEEVAIYGYTHAQLGAFIARNWGLPDEINHVIYNHHNPIQSQHSVVTTYVIDVADKLANALGYGIYPKRENIYPEILSSDSAVLLKISEENLKLICERTEANLRWIMSVF